MSSATAFNVNALEAAQLSSLAYIPLQSLAFLPHEATKDDLSDLSDQERKELARYKELMPEGWRYAPPISTYGRDPGAPDRNNQIATFINDEKKQVVMAFKGSDNMQNFASDVRDDGGSEWMSVRGDVESILQQRDLLYVPARIREHPDYKPYCWSVTGHSLGGGLAQTCAILHDMSGHVQNALPISNMTVKSELWGKKKLAGPSAFKEAIEAWQESHKLTAAQVKDDIAHAFYHDLKHGNFIHTHVLELPHHVKKIQGQAVAQIPENQRSMTPFEAFTSAVVDTGLTVMRALGLLVPISVSQAIDAHLGDTVIKVIKALEEQNNPRREVARRATLLGPTESGSRSPSLSRT